VGAAAVLTQDLDRFDLEHYRQLRGQFSLDDLRKFVEKVVLRLGGAFVPLGDECYRIETPPVLLSGRAGVLARYESASFNRDVATRRRKVEFMGLGHPFIDAVLAYLKSASWHGEATKLRDGQEGPFLSARWLVTVQVEVGKSRQHYRHIAVNGLGSIRRQDERQDLDVLARLPMPAESTDLNPVKLRAYAYMSTTSLSPGFRRTWYETVDSGESELRFSTLPFLFAAVSNLVGGLARDAAVTHWGLKWGQRSIGIVGLVSSALFLAGALLSANKWAAGILLALCYSAVNFHVPTLWATCVDIGKRNAGAVAGFMNTAANLGAVASSAVFGQVVGRTGSYDVPLVTMLVALLVGASLWLRVDATEELRH
jgi:hypothetical protein